MKKLIVGQNDLKSLHPSVAKQAYGWDPSTVLPGSNKRLEWKCSLGHLWKAQPWERTGKNKTGCPVCANKKVLAGFNDLKKRYPSIADEAYGWDPETIMPGSVKKLPWKCKENHTWEASPNSRTNNLNGCPFCGNKKVWSGFNDLETKFPEIALEAHGWDPKNTIFSTKKKMTWLCSKGHSYKASAGERTGRDKTGCPYCSNKKVLPGFNDLRTTHPEIAVEAHEWDPTTLTAGSSKTRNWICPLGHIYDTAIAMRTGPRKEGCSFCAGKKVLLGFNDLQTLFPEIAKQANGWDPSKVTKSSGRIMSWICDKGHHWKAEVGNRTRNGTGCPECAVTGFNPGKVAWFYLLERPGEQQFGITNFIEDRLKYHSNFGWTQVEVTGPHDGKEVQKAEAFLKKWLRREIGLIPGTTENWEIKNLDIASLTELKRLSGLSTNIF
jgi:hypothetical protein